MYDIVDLNNDNILHSELSHSEALRIYVGMADQSYYVIVSSI